MPEVLEVLTTARGLIDLPEKWSSSGWGSEGRRCAVHALDDSGESQFGYSLPALCALESAMGEYPGIFNDERTHAEVLAAFDKAIATVRLQAHLEATPNADAALEMMAACDTAGAVLARQIVANHPHMDLREVEELASGELFYAAQDTAKACGLGVTVARA